MAVRERVLALGSVLESVPVWELALAVVVAVWALDPVQEPAFRHWQHCQRA